MRDGLVPPIFVPTERDRGSQEEPEESGGQEAAEVQGRSAAAFSRGSDSMYKLLSVGRSFDRSIGRSVGEELTFFDLFGRLGATIPV